MSKIYKIGYIMMPFSDEELYYAVENAIPKVGAYVDSHGGGVTLLGVKDGVVYIELIGTCSGCSMSIMTTNMVIRRELRELIHPQLFVVNVDGKEENIAPDDIFRPATEENENPKLFDKVKGIFS